MLRLHVLAVDFEVVHAHLSIDVGVSHLSWAGMPDGSVIFGVEPQGTGDRAHMISHPKVMLLPDPLSPRPVAAEVLARFPHIGKNIIKGGNVSVTAYDLFAALYSHKPMKGGVPNDAHVGHPLLDPELR